MVSGAVMIVVIAMVAGFSETLGSEAGSVVSLATCVACASSCWPAPSRASAIAGVGTSDIASAAVRTPVTTLLFFI